MRKKDTYGVLFHVLGIFCLYANKCGGDVYGRKKVIIDI